MQRKAWRGVRKEAHQKGCLGICRKERKLTEADRLNKRLTFMRLNRDTSTLTSIKCRTMTSTKETMTTPTLVNQGQ
jgi:hypothetical protein